MEIKGVVGRDILFIDFYKYQEKSPGNKAINTVSLSEQFEALSTRLAARNRPGSLGDLINVCFPPIQRTYRIAVPNFNRELQSGHGTLEYLNNVVIRPDLTDDIKAMLPEGLNMTITGDIQKTDNGNRFIVNGIELLDQNVAAFGELIIRNARACTKYDGRWSLGNYVPYGESILTMDVLTILQTTAYTVSDRNRVFSLGKKWDALLTFNENYLKMKQQRTFKVTSTSLLDSHVISRRTYNKDREAYMLLDGKSEFARGDQIVIGSPAPDSDSFPLIRVDFDFIQKDLYREDNLGRHKKPRDLSAIELFVRDNMSLSDKAPTKDSATYQKQLRSALTLGDRLKVLVTKDIEPDYGPLDKKLLQDKNKTRVDHEKRNETLINHEIGQFRDKRQMELNGQVDHDVEAFKNDLVARLERDIEENKDKEVIAAYEKEVQSIRSRLEAEYKKTIKALTPGKKNKGKPDPKVLEELKLQYRENIDRRTKLVSVKDYYVKRNERLVKDRQFSLSDQAKRTLDNDVRIEGQAIRARHKDILEKELDEAYSGLDEIYRKDKADLKLNETKTRVSVYFRTDGDYEETVEMYESGKWSYLIYNSIAEDKKLKRMKNAWDQLMSGRVKNPFLSTYLFEPKSLGPLIIPDQDPEWFLDNLNAKQKEAVRKAVHSNGMFLLQGPPGTGKTQVIAEIIGHLVKAGKKVLVSSETHKAIDNVFERLPKIPDIRPIRLIPDTSKKKTRFNPEDLVSNMYDTMTDQMKKTIADIEDFESYREEFKERMDLLKIRNKKLKTHEATLREYQIKQEKYERDIERITEKQRDMISKKNLLEDDLARLRNTRRAVTHDQAPDDIDDFHPVMERYVEDVAKVMRGFKLLEVEPNRIKDVLAIDPEEIQDELQSVNPDSRRHQLESKAEKLKSDIKGCLDELGQERPERQDDLVRFRGELINLNREIDELGSEDALPESKVSGIVAKSVMMDLSKHQALIEEIKKMQDKIGGLKNAYLTEIDELEKKTREHISIQNNAYDACLEERKAIGSDKKTLDDAIADEGLLTIQSDLKIEIGAFFNRFNINRSYATLTEALDIIEDQWSKIVKEHEKTESQIRNDIAAYTKITRYLSDETVIEADKPRFTKALFDKANLFGATTTSRDSFKESHITDLSKYNLGDIDLKTVGIDVVIVDEVSKSSLVELLIPILNGKTVILVGDHRQLPPMYEHRFLTDEDLEGLEMDDVTKKTIEEQTGLYEECLFKTIFEQIPEDYKVRLTKQYRSHSHIMDVYNHFYDGQLELGLPDQNTRKEHHLTIVSKDRTIIEPDRHVYFVNCSGYESREAGSTSMYNPREARVVVELLKMIDKAYQDNTTWQNMVNKDKRRDLRASVGVITTYGEQAKQIKNLKKGIPFPMFNKDPDQRLIISTVDDFQGDERDIIILSMVRNPGPEKKSSNPGFITAYQRINVAMSRARKMLIIVGNSTYLTTRGIIDLPNIDGDATKDKKRFPIYEKVIQTIRSNGRGRVIEDIDIVESDKR